MISLILNLLALITGATVAGESPRAELLFIGDAMQHEGQLKKAKEIGKDHYDFSQCFTLMAPVIQAADYAVVNLEVPLGGPGTYSGYPCFSAPDSYAQALKDAGFDMMLTSNNHCLDKRDKGARRTIAMLDSLNLDHIGTYKTKADRDSLVPFIKNINGFKVAFLNYTYGTNGIEPTDGVEVALIDKNKMKKEIDLSREKGAEIVVVTIHWGIEYVLLQNKTQEGIADFLVDAGADMIIGGHPHVIQPMKVVRNEKENKDVLVVYSLGNFISNMNTADTRGGAMVWTTLSRDENGKARFDHADYDIFYSAKPDGSNNFRVIPSWEEDKIPSNQKSYWTLFQRGALDTFNKHNVNVPRRISSAQKSNDSGK